MKWSLFMATSISQKWISTIVLIEGVILTLNKQWIVSKVNGSSLMIETMERGFMIV